MRYALRFTFLLFAIAMSSSAFSQNLLSKANKQYELKAYPYAVANYIKVLQKEPNEPQALARLADSYRILNRMDDAEKYFARAVQVAGIDPVHFLHYGKVLMAQGKYETAKLWFNTYAESDPITGAHYAKSCDYALSLRGQPATFRAYKEYLNSTNSDFGPAFFGDYIVYSSSRTDIKRARKPNVSKGFSESPNNQLYISSMDKNGYLRTPTLWQSDLQNNYNEGPVTFSKDGTWVVYTRNIFESGVRQLPEAGGTMAMYIAEVNADGSWKNVKALPFNKSGYSAGYPAFSPDGKLLYFASNRDGGFGGWDLYSSFRTANGWSVPQNLGPVVNTPGDEISPSLDGGTLYFSSDYHHGLGGMDIFKAQKKDSEWNEVYHLGTTINSSFDDYGFIFSSNENRGYMVTNRKGTQGHEDIFKVKKMTDNFVISVVNESDMRPIEGAVVDFSDCGEPSFTTDINGKYAFEALAGLGCEVIVKKEGFKSYSLKLNSLGERLTRKYEVKLRNIGDEYVGKIVDSQSNESVEGVYVKATNRNSGLTLKTQTNQRGEYRLALQQPEEYTIRYSKAGYIDTHKKVKISSKTDKSVLGILSFKTSYSAGNAFGGVVESTDDGDDVVILELDEIPTSSSGSTANANSNSGNNGSNIRIETDPLDAYSAEDAMPKGYAVQVAAYFDEREVNVGKYQNLQEIGNVYKMKEGKAEKVRVGIFPTKREANAARKAISQKGYQKAFIVAEEGKQNFALRIEEEQVEEKGKEIKPVVRIPKVDYKVRVATFRSTKNFDDNQISDFGKVERRKRGKFTIVLLSGFESEKEAKLTQQKMENLGYKDAHLVIEDGKDLKRIQ